MVRSEKSITGDRMIIDLVVPGYAKENITVQAATKHGGKNFVLTVKGDYVRPTGATGKVVPKFAFDKCVGDSFKWSDELPLDDDYRLDGIQWDCTNGVFRISVPKTAEAIGKKITAAEGNINAVGGDED
jgi:HSP20 family molecular chaperone IbpA